MNLKTKLLSTIFKTLVVFGFLVTMTNSNAQIASWSYDMLIGATNAPTSNTGSGTSSIVSDVTQFPNNSFQGRTAGSGCGAPDAGFSWGFFPFNPGTNTESNGIQYNTSTVGYTNITLAWDMQFSATAPNTIRLQYTSDGSTWVNVNMNTVSTTICAGSIAANGCYVMNGVGTYRHLLVDFTSIPAVANNVNFGVRILAAYDPNYGTSPTYGGFRQTTDSTLPATNTGSWRFDNVVIGGTIQPGPTASVISGTASICNGLSTNLSVAITGGTGPFTLVYTDASTNFTVLNYTSGAFISVTPTGTKSYTIVSVTNANGQVGTGNIGTATVTVKAKPTVTITSGSACTAISFNLNTLITSAGTPTGGTGFFSRSSSPATPIASPTAYLGVTIPDLIYTYTGPNACSVVSNVVTFTRNSVPVITTQPTGSQTVCQGTAFSPITITATGATSYSWYYNASATFTGATLIPLSSTAAYVPPSASIYGPRYFAVRASNTCGGVNSTSWAGPFYVTAPTVAGTVAGTQTICANTNPTTDLVLSGNTGTVVKWERANDIGFTTGVADIVSTANPLTGAAIGSLSQTTYIRAYVKNGTCAAVPTAPIQILIKTTTYSAGAWSNSVPDSSTSAIFAGDYSSTGDLNACSVQVNSGNVVINSNHTITIQNGLTVAGGTLTFEDKASLVQVNSTANSGIITYKRKTTPIRKFDYTYWSTPVDGQILANLSPFTLSDKYFWFNTTIYNWTAVAVPGLTFMDIGKGYIIRAPQNFDPLTAAPYEGSFIGTPNNGDYTVSIVKTGANDLNCIGNPYPSALSADAFIAQNTGAFGATPGTTLYFWTHNTPITNNVYTFSDYATYNYSGGTGAGVAAPGVNTTIPNGKIAAGQAFMVKGIVPGTTTATFKNAMRVAGNNDRFFRSNSAIGTPPLERNRVWLELKNNQGAYKQILVGYIQNATNGLDNGYDGEVLEAGNSVSFYSVLADKKLAIQGRSLPFVSNDQIPLGYKTAAATSFQIHLSDFDGLFGNQNVYLEDTLLHVVHDLKAAPYDFVTELGTFDTRFVLRFTNAALGLSDVVWNENTVIAYQNLDQIVVSASTLKIATVSVYDLSGRLLYDHKKVNAKEISFAVGSAAKVLLIRITSENNQTVTKKILR